MDEKILCAVPREFTEGEYAMIMRLEDTANDIEALIKQIGEHIDKMLQQAHEEYLRAEDRMEPQRLANAEATMSRLEKSVPQNWLNIANMELKQGMMALRRALAQPTNF